MIEETDVDITKMLISYGIDYTEITLLIAENINKAVSNHVIEGDDPSWLSGAFMMPAQDGSMGMNQYLSVSIASPVLGAPSPTATAIIDLRVLRDPIVADETVADLMTKVRDLRSQMLAEINPATDFDFSSLPS